MINTLVSRYDYLYSPDELDPWIDRIKAVAEAANETYVVTNDAHFSPSSFFTSAIVLSFQWRLCSSTLMKVLGCMRSR